MKSRIAMSLAAIALAGSLASCSAENPEGARPAPDVVAPTGSPEYSTTPLETKTAHPEIPTGSIDVPLEAVPTAENMYTEQARPAGEIADGPAKRGILYISGKIEAYLAAGGAPTKPNCIDAVSLGGLDDLEAGVQAGCMWEEDGSYTLFTDHPDDPNYSGGNFVLRHNSVKGFIQ